jgi:hypothetical protein
VRTRVKRFLFGTLLGVVFLYCFPYFEGMQSANELPRVYLTMAMVDEGTFAIDTGVERWGVTADMSPSGGHTYSNKAPGSSMLAIPAYALLKFTRGLTGAEPSLAEITWTCRIVTGVLPTLLFLFMLWRFLGRFAGKPRTRRLLLTGYGLGSMALTYSVIFVSHQLAAICIASAYIISVWVIEEGLDKRWMGLMGFLAGCAPLVDYQAAFAGVPIAVYVLYHLLVKSREKALGVLYAVLGAAAPIAVLLSYHAMAFGSPFRTGYAASESFAHFHNKGFLGMDKLRSEAFVGSFFSLDNGLLVLAPMFLLAIPGWFFLGKRKQWWHLGITLSVAVIYVAFVSSIIFWRGGWQVGPRYITAMLPFLMVPIAVTVAWAERRWVARSVVVGLIGVGVFVYTLSSAMFPHFPEKFKNPVFELVLPLIGGGHAPYNAGWLLGLRGFASLFPYLLLVLGTWIWVACPSKQDRRSALVASLVAAAILLIYSTFPGGGALADGAYERILTWMP